VPFLSSTMNLFQAHYFFYFSRNLIVKVIFFFYLFSLFLSNFLWFDFWDRLTALLKVTTFCPCKGCNNRIHRAVLKNKGVIFIFSFLFFCLIFCCLDVFHIRNQDFRGDHLRGLIRRCRLEVTALFFFVSFLNYLLPFLLQELLLIFLKGLIFCFLSSRTTKSLNFFVFLSLLHLALHFGFICVSLGNFFFVF